MPRQWGRTPELFFIGLLLLLAAIAKGVLDLAEISEQYQVLVLIAGSGALMVLLSRKNLSIKTDPSEAELKDKVGDSTEKPLIRSDALLEEYRTLMAEMTRRDTVHIQAQSILVSGSLVAVSFVLDSFSSRTLQAPLASGVILVAIVLVVMAWVLDYTTTLVDRVQLDRTNVIARRLGFNTQTDLFNRAVKGKKWYYLRRRIWPTVFSVLIVFYVSALVFVILL